MTLVFACEPAVTETEIFESNCDCELEVLDATQDIPGLIDAATDAIYHISGGLVSGRCTVTVRPCGDGGCVCGYGPACYCCVIDGIPLKGFNPVVSQVKIDGVVVPSTEYAMVNGRKLVRRDGAAWPGAKNPLLADTEDGTFSITYSFGMDHDFLAKQAVIEMVCEIALTLKGEGRLPNGTVSATADGVQIVIGRLPGRQDVEAVGLTWLGRFMAFYGETGQTTVLSPELNEGWTLNVVT